MSRFIRSLSDLIPRTGRLIRENGEYVNPLGDGEILQESIVDSGNQPGATRLSNVTFLEDVFLCFNIDRVIKIDREDAGNPYDLGIMLVVWEEELNA